MLQIKALDPTTLVLLKKLSIHNELRHFVLGGGSALALQLGHRLSIDLDFFTKNSFDASVLAQYLSAKFSLHNITTSKNSLTGYILHESTGVKVDFLRHNYVLLNPILKEGNTQLFSLEDIAAMKLNAIANRGAKKDFFDIYSLLEKFTIEEMLNLFEQKYPQVNSFSLIKSLTYFDDADNEPDPISLINVRWEEVKQKVLTEVKSE